MRLKNKFDGKESRKKQKLNYLLLANAWSVVAIRYTGWMSVFCKQVVGVLVWGVVVKRRPWKPLICTAINWNVGLAFSCATHSLKIQWKVVWWDAIAVIYAAEFHSKPQRKRQFVVFTGCCFTDSYRVPFCWCLLNKTGSDNPSDTTTVVLLGVC